MALRVTGLVDPIHLPEKALAPGRYWWRWGCDGDWADVSSFEIGHDAVVLEVPSADQWLQRLPAGHPRMFIRPEQRTGLRQASEGRDPDAVRELRQKCDAALARPHEMAEWPFLPPWSVDYKATYDLWLQGLRESRRFVWDARDMALGYLLFDDESCARAACQRMASVAKWDPMGSSHIAHNDELHMSVIWGGPLVCDWVWDRFTDQERDAVIEQFRQRGRITYEHMHDRGLYGVTQFNSHPGREVVFLALLAMVFHEHIPEARQWLAWLRPVLCGVWPVWAGDDGAWAEGISYSLAYVEIMSTFATALARGAGVDLYRRPFWKGYAKWLTDVLPSYAQWVGFGDGTERRGITASAADLVEIIGRGVGTTQFQESVAAYRREAAKDASLTPETAGGTFNVQRILAPSGTSAQRDTRNAAAAGADPSRVLNVFPAAGWAAFRTARSDPQRDIALIFRSSPFGSVSHSHANNNDFILHVAGQVMAMPSGYYDGYGSAHHTHWIWHTRSHNCLTLSEAGQMMQSFDSTGATENAVEDERIAYLRGTADGSYGDRATRCRRHVLFIKAHGCFALIDELETNPANPSALQWNIHSWSPFDVDASGRSFTWHREQSSVKARVMCHIEASFRTWEGFDPPPQTTRASDEWRPTHHLRFSLGHLSGGREQLGVLLCPSHAQRAAAKVRCERVGETEVAWLGEEGDVLMVRGGGAPIDAGGLQSGHLALLRLSGCVYEVTDAGLITAIPG